MNHPLPANDDTAEPATDTAPREPGYPSVNATDGAGGGGDQDIVPADTPDEIVPDGGDDVTPAQPDEIAPVPGDRDLPDRAPVETPPPPA